MKRYQALFLILFFVGLLPNSFAYSESMHFKLKDIKGNIVDSKDFIGKKPTLVSFWTQWCVLCRTEFPIVIDFHEKYSEKGLVIVAINRDAPEDYEKMKRYAEKINAPFSIIGNAGRLPYAYKALTIPFFVLFDETGNVLERTTVVSDFEPALKKMFEKR